MLISILTPCYNVEKFIDEYFHSVLEQTYKDIEIVCVDDGSTDNTWKILQEYGKKDARVKVYKLEQNSGGCKLPRETAALHATADWIVNVDADDFLDKDYIEKLVRRQQETGADTVLTCSRPYYPVKPVQEYGPIPAEDFDYSRLLTGEEATELTIAGWKISPAGCLTKKQNYINRANFLIYNHDETRANADELTGREILIASKLVAFTKTDYRCRNNPESITHRPLEQFLTFGTDWDLYELLCKHYGSQSAVAKKQMAVYISHLLRLKRKHNLKNKELDRSIQKLTWSDVNKSSYSWLRKVRCFIRLLLIQRKLNTNK